MTEEKIEVKYAGGVGSFFYAGIFWVFGVGALAWLGVVTGVVEFHHHLTLAKRMDNRVGVSEPLKNPVKVIIRGHQGCVKVDRTYADGDSITLYIRSACSEDLSYYEWGWKAKAPDGTVIKEHYDNTLNYLEPGGKVEKVMELPDDDRIATIEVWAQNHHQ